MNYQFDFNFLKGNFGLLWDGLKVTLQLALVSNIVGLVLGFGLCLLTLSRWFFLRWPAQLFIEFFRCTPVLLQIVWFFYCVPMLFDVFIDPITMGVLALGLNLTAFNAEAYRAGVQAVPHEHLDASVALGLRPWQRTLYVILPQALRTCHSGVDDQWHLDPSAECAGGHRRRGRPDVRRQKHRHRSLPTAGNLFADRTHLLRPVVAHRSVRAMAGTSSGHCARALRRLS